VHGGIDGHEPSVFTKPAATALKHRQRLLHQTQRGMVLRIHAQPPCHHPVAHGHGPQAVAVAARFEHGNAGIQRGTVAQPRRQLTKAEHTQRRHDRPCAALGHVGGAVKSLPGRIQIAIDLTQ
jgi:hypothetical protein